MHNYKYFLHLAYNYLVVISSFLRPILKNKFSLNTFTVKLWQDFEALFQSKNKFASANLHHHNENVIVLCIRYKYVYVETCRLPQIMHQNIAIMLLQLY